MKVVCPKCEERFRISDDTPAGKRLKCPECAAVFSFEDDDEEPVPRKSSRSRDRDEDEDDRAGSRSARGGKKRSRDRDDDDEDEDRPRRKKKKKSKAGLVWALVLGGVALLAGGVVLILVLVLGGTTYDSATRESMSIMEDWAAILETVKDPASAKAAIPRLERIASRFESLQKRVKDLPQPKPEEINALAKKYEAQQTALSQRFFSALAAANQNSRNEPSFREAMRKINLAQMKK